MGAVALYVRLIRQSYPQEPDWPGRRSVIVTVAAVQIVICVGSAASYSLPVIIGSGAGVIVPVLVIWSLCRPTIRKLGDIA